VRCVLVFQSELEAYHDGGIKRAHIDNAEFIDQFKLKSLHRSLQSVRLARYAYNLLCPATSEIKTSFGKLQLNCSFIIV
jgi:hypothetical protein